MNTEKLHQLTQRAGDQFLTGPLPLDGIERRARSSMFRRRLSVGAAGGVLAVASLIGITSVIQNHSQSSKIAAQSLGPLTSSQYAEAVAAAQVEINEQEAKITAANATIMNEPVDGNLAPCPTPSLRVQLIGSFPNIRTGGAPTSPDGGSHDATPTSLLITLDPQSNEVCQVGVSTGTPHVYPDTANLLPALGPPGTEPSSVSP